MTPLDFKDHENASFSDDHAAQLLLGSEPRELARLTWTESPSRRHLNAQKYNPKVLELLENVGIGAHALDEKEYH